ncbi:MAG: hypothetical protein GF308_13450 [Candidatus Heimdallarchaeota archaeon]|nr:hypothetical protein [Candidatus Heimdallarchaeota archaeon]
MNIDLSQLDFQFTSKPLLVGGKALEYYDIRKAGSDTDFIITKEDYLRLAEKFPDNTKDIKGDLGVCIFEFEIWYTIRWHSYEDLSFGAIEKEEYLIISLEKLLLMKALAMEIPKYHNDLELIVNFILTNKSRPHL